ncbi:MAG: retroviral-like aspartic protease family protein [Deltaproteobacteria bacterium]|nr:retroviral-like aspartic protease family protein [Deltaproteobacteria bacterium]
MIKKFSACRPWIEIAHLSIQENANFPVDGEPMPNITTFDPKKRYILFPVFVTTKGDKKYKVDALLDTGAPATEFSDDALQFAGLLEKTRRDVVLKPGLQTQKYGKVVLPRIEICSHPIDNLEVYISHFDKSWGIKALVGLDFFRRFRTTVDYKVGHIVTEPL